MNPSCPVLEVAVFTVKPECIDRMPELRAGLRAAVGRFPGLIQLHTYEPVADGRHFADLALWRNLEDALAVARAFESGDPHFLPYMQAIESLTFMGHMRESDRNA